MNNKHKIEFQLMQIIKIMIFNITKLIIKMDLIIKNKLKYVNIKIVLSKVKTYLMIV